MSLPWQKAANAEILAGMSIPYPDGFKVWPWLVRIEARAVAFSDARSVWTVRRLADRWGCGKSQAAAAMKSAEQAYDEATGQNGTAAGQAPDKTGQPTPSNQAREEADRTNADTGRTAAGHLACARSIRRDQNEDADQTPPQSPPKAGGFKPQAEALDPMPPRDERADPGDLSEIWNEELDSSPDPLRGKRAGLMAQWPVDLLMLSPERAAMAVRAVAELCRGTETRAPRVLQWRAFFAPTRTTSLEDGWRDALAWKEGAAGEPPLGRTWKGSKTETPAAPADWDGESPIFRYTEQP